MTGCSTPLTSVSSAAQVDAISRSDSRKNCKDAENLEKMRRIHTLQAFESGETRMPIYEYGCDRCGHEFETMQKISEAPLTKCPACGHDSLRKKVSAAGFRLKGGGWYETDFKKSGDKKRNVDGGSSPDSSSAGTSTSDSSSSPASSSPSTPSPSPSSSSSSSSGSSD